MQTDDIQKWLLENVDPSLVPNDEGLYEGLLYNFLMVVENNPERWSYQDHQYRYLEEMKKKYNVQAKP
jgi:hypothetical protein